MTRDYVSVRVDQEVVQAGSGPPGAGSEQGPPGPVWAEGGQVKRIVQNLSVARTDESDRALETIKQTGMSQSDATRWALVVASNLLENAWRNGHEVRGVVPDMRVAYKVKKDLGRA